MTSSPNARAEPVTRDELARLREALGAALLVDEKRLAGALDKLLRDSAEPYPAQAAELAERVEASLAQVAAREAACPTMGYNPDLPIVGAREEIAEALAKHRVVVIAGDTGSGKSTQLPKMLLELGFGRRGRIGMTQPRRIAARAIANRLAYETGTEVGKLVGVSTRFDDRVAADTAVKVMTDGILLNEIHSDRRLLQYDSIIIDEAHERSLNIDFLLGYLKDLTRRRRDLTVVITSATIDPERFAAFFDDAPVLKVGGRTYPVELRYLEEPEAPEKSESRERDRNEDIAQAIRHLAAEGRDRVLVFLPGEREISEAREHLAGALAKGTEILPLYSRLSRQAQDRVYTPATGARVILATNVAETSLTVPGINAVVDTGTARISRYSPRSKVQRLPVEPVSQAAATQRAGRCGREGPGVCIRLYTEADFNSRSEFTDPEILRTNLATVILKLKALGIGELAHFPFLDPPPKRLVKDGYRLLDELGALTADQKLTAAGRLLARLPVDPQLGRMLIEARAEDAVREVTVIAAALSVQDVREFPGDRLDDALTGYKRWADPQSDFLWFLNFWDREVDARESWGALKKTCFNNAISFMRVREWIDIHRQLKVQLEKNGVKAGDRPARYKAIHRALLSGLLSNVSKRTERNDYLSARGTGFRLARTSILASKRSPWLLVMQIVETHRNSARLAAKIDPAWLISVARHVIATDYGEVTWDARQGEARVAASRRLFQHVIQADLNLRLADVDPSAARDVLLREGLVAGAIPGKQKEVLAFRDRLAALKEEESRQRRQDILKDEDALVLALDERLPEAVVDHRSLCEAIKKNRSLLAVPDEALIRAGARRPGGDAFPDSLRVLGHALPLSYHFAPGEDEDGVTVALPLHLLNATREAHFERLVPGLFPEKLEALLRGLPKAQRKRLQPIGAVVPALIDRLNAKAGDNAPPLAEELAALIAARLGEDIAPRAFEAAALPPYLSMRIALIDETGDLLAVSRNLGVLQERFASRGRKAFTEAAHEGIGIETHERDTRWTWDSLPETVNVGQGDRPVQAWPALSDCGDSVELAVFQTATEARARHPEGVLRLALIALHKEFKYARRQLPERDAIALAYVAFGDVNGLVEDLITRTIRDLMAVDVRPPRQREDFEARVAKVRRELLPALTEAAKTVRAVVSDGAEVRRRAAEVRDPAFTREIHDQLTALIGAGFAARHSHAQLKEFPRYVKTLTRRIERFLQNPVKDQRKAAQVAPYAARMARLVNAAGTVPANLSLVAEGQRLLEEWRVSLFAQELGTRMKVSPERLDTFFAEAEEALR